MKEGLIQNTRLLTDTEETDDYIDLLALSIEEACLNDYYPAATALVASLELMMPTVHLGIHPALELHADTALPTYKEFVRVLSDWRGAREELGELERWKDRDGDDIYGKLARKYRYYTTLSETAQVYGESRRIYFRKIDKATASALFRVVLDRITPTGYLERLTVEMGQHASLWGRRELTVDDVDAVEMSANLEGLVYRMASHDADVIFVNLNAQEGIQVSSVIKGRIGPFLFAGAAPAEPFAPLMSVVGDGGLLMLSLHTADVMQLTDVFNDPFAKEATFSLAARGELAPGGSGPLFHVMTDRKFVLTDGDRAGLEAFLRGHGTRNLIYETRG